MAKSTLISVTLTVLSLLVATSKAYLELQITIDQNKERVAYNIPMTINSHQYKLAASIQNKQEFINPLSSTKLSKRDKKTHKNPSDIYGVIKVTSLEGYSFEGWRRYFMEAFLYISQRYYHQVTINLDSVKQRESVPNDNLTNGVITFGPNMEQNKIFIQLRKNTQYITQNIMAIYAGRSGGKNARLQLGGYEESFAYGHKDGFLFYQIPLLNSSTHWLLPIDVMICAHQKSKQWDQFHVNFKELSLKLSIESQYLILPSEFAPQIERNFITKDVECSVANSSLICTNMTVIDLALNMFSFRIGTSWINISLYDLRDDYFEKGNKTSFFIKFDQNSSNWQLGNALFKAHYVAIDMSKKTMLYSPINRFPDNFFSTVYVIRFIVFFILFTVAVSIAVAIWQRFANPNLRNKFTRGDEGVGLVTYTRPGGQDYEQQ